MDVFVICVFYVGSKLFFYVLVVIECIKDWLVDVGVVSDVLRMQIIEVVMMYWSVYFGVVLSIVEKFLNYFILILLMVINWVLNVQVGKMCGEVFVWVYMYELVFNIVIKVIGWVRQLVVKVSQLDEMVDDEMRDNEVRNMRELFRVIEDSLGVWVGGMKDEMFESNVCGEEDGLVRRWGMRWLRVFKWRQVIEEVFLVEVVREWERREEVRKEWEVVEWQRREERERKEVEEKERNGVNGVEEKKKENGVEGEVNIIEQQVGCWF